MKLTNTLIATSLLLSVSACDAKQTDDDWQVLFDGTNLDAWRTYQQDSVNPKWEIVEGVLTLTEAGGGDIITKEQFENFELSLEWKITEGGNSGIFFHVVERDDLGAVYLSGPEYQVLDNSRGEPPLEQAGALFALYAPVKDLTKTVGAFNTSRLIVKGDEVEHWLNGQMIVSYTMGSDDFNAKVKASKFGAWPAFAASRVGHIALQDHGDVVGYRNIKIRRLDP